VQQGHDFTEDAQNGAADKISIGCKESLEGSKPAILGRG